MLSMGKSRISVYILDASIHLMEFGSILTESRTYVVALKTAAPEKVQLKWLIMKFSEVLPFISTPAATNRHAIKPWRSTKNPKHHQALR